MTARAASACADEALEQALEDEWGADEAVGGPDQLHHLYLLAPGEDGEPYGVRDKEHARDQEQERRPVETPDHDRGYGVQAVDGLLRVAEVVFGEALLLELVGHLVCGAWVL